MPVTTLDPWASVQTGLPYTMTLPLGSAWQPGDIRVYALSVSSSRSLASASSGWTWLGFTGAPGSRTVGFLARVLQAGDSAPSVTTAGSSGINIGHCGITLRGADSAGVMSWQPTVTGGTSRNVTAPSISTGAGRLLTVHWVTRSGSANSGTFTAPSGMTREAWSLSDGSGGYNVLIASLPTSGGMSGEKTAQAESSTANWSAASLFVPELPTPAPAVNAGADATIEIGGTFTRTAVESGGAVTSRAWTVASGPAQVGATLSTTTALSWTPGVVGTYVLHYTASNSSGSVTDNVTVTVEPPPGPEPGRFLLAS